jgi:excinuclease ABC subunit A
MSSIHLRGVRVHNLQGIDLDLPANRLIVITGVSGAGKTSLAFDTLFAEGQRRYVESFAVHSRRRLDALERPDADLVEGVPAAVAVRRHRGTSLGRGTVATASEVDEHLRLLFARCGEARCPACDLPVRSTTPAEMARQVHELPAGTKVQLGFPLDLGSATPSPPLPTSDSLTNSHRGGEGRGEGARSKPRRTKSNSSPTDTLATSLTLLREAGFQRLLAEGRTVDLRDLSTDFVARLVSSETTLRVVVDRVTSGTTPLDRLTDSFELAVSRGQGRAWCLIEQSGKSPPADSVESVAGVGLPPTVVAVEKDAVGNPPPDFAMIRGQVAGTLPASSTPSRQPDPGHPDVDRSRTSPPPDVVAPASNTAPSIEIDGRPWHLLEFSTRRECTGCGRPFPEPDAAFLSFLGPQGACPECNGTGQSRTSRQTDSETLLRSCPGCKGRRWNSDALAHHWRGLTLADFSAGTVDQRHEQLRHLLDGPTPESVDSPPSPPHSTDTDTPTLHCGGEGARRADEGAELTASPLKGGPATSWPGRAATRSNTFRSPSLETSPLTPTEQLLLPPLVSRLATLIELGLGHLQLDRSPTTLSAGDWRRVRLANALGCELVEALYVVDEPTAGLHPAHTPRLIALLKRLRDAGNTVVVVEHDDTVISHADWVVDLGPGAGVEGGRVLYSGPPTGLKEATGSITAKWQAHPVDFTGDRRTPTDWITVKNAHARTLKHLDVKFPLGVLCVITGVGGAGKRTLVEHTLYRAWSDRLAAQPHTNSACDSLTGGESVRWVRRVDSASPAKSRRANVSTYLGVHDEVRKLLAATPTAKSRQFTAGTFSFHSPSGGRCPVCEGEGVQRVDMQFLPDVAIPCSACGGARFKPEVLEATFRGLNIAQMLDLSVGDAFAFFRGSVRVQKRLKHVKDVGLDHLPLGRSLATLSEGEAQRLKLARELDDSAGERGALFLEEPTSGLHAADIERLLACLDQLVSNGHSLFVIEHHLQVIAAADWVIDLGPGAGKNGGHLLHSGPPATLLDNPNSLTARHLDNPPREQGRA